MVDNKLRDNARLSQRDLNKTSKLLIVWEINENVESNLFNNTADIHTYTYICTINRRIHRDVSRNFIISICDNPSILILRRYTLIIDF